MNDNQATYWVYFIYSSLLLQLHFQVEIDVAVEVEAQDNY